MRGSVCDGNFFEMSGFLPGSLKRIAEMHSKPPSGYASVPCLSGISMSATIAQNARASTAATASSRVIATSTWCPIASSRCRVALATAGLSSIRRMR